MIAVVREHIDAVITRLQALGVTVGDAQAPTGPPPYCVVYSIAGGRTSGVLGAPDDDAEMVVQVTCVGVSRQQAQWLEDKAMGLLAGFTVSGRSVARVDLEMFGGVVRDDAKSQPVFYSTPRFRVYSTPS